MSGQRYHSINRYLKSIFNKKIIKLSIDGGFTCPNRDGFLSDQGCIFCSEQGSGEFAGDLTGKGISTEGDAFSRPVPAAIAAQYHSQINLLKSKWPSESVGYIMYFQNFTNTYAPTEILRQKYEEALSMPGVVGLAIATRPDCLSPEILDLLEELNEKTFLWIELGLQTIHDTTAKQMNRQYPFTVYGEAEENLKKRNIKIVVHLILGLPGETPDQMLESIKYVAYSNIFGLKLHLLHVIKNTPLAYSYARGEFSIFQKEAYIQFICDALEIIPWDLTIHRLTGDAPKELLIAPLWSSDKKSVLNGINKELALRNANQGTHSPPRL